MSNGRDNIPPGGVDYGAADYARIAEIFSTDLLDLGTEQPQSDPREVRITGNTLMPSLESSGIVFVRLGSVNAARIAMRAGSKLSGEFERRAFLDWQAQPGKVFRLLFGQNVDMIPGVLNVQGIVDTLQGGDANNFIAGTQLTVPPAGERNIIMLRNVGERVIEIQSLIVEAMTATAPRMWLTSFEGLGGTLIQSANGIGDAPMQSKDVFGGQSSSMEIRHATSAAAINNPVWVERIQPPTGGDPNPAREVIEHGPIILPPQSDPRSALFPGVAELDITSEAVDVQFAFAVQWRER